MTYSRTAARATLSVAAVAALALASASIAPAQLPEGMNPADVQSMIPSEVTVRAGETTTVDLGVPVDVNYSSGGWQVTSNGTQVSVTAPDTPGATASVPASAGGMTATVNLVAVGEGEQADADDVAEGGGGAAAGGSGGGSASEGAGEDSGESTGGAGEGGSGGGGGGASQSSGGGGEAAPARGDRQKAEEVDTSGAKRLAFDGEIDGNTLVVKVSLRKARDLMKYANADREGAKLRYVDAQGNIIKGVKRDVDAAKRTMTLTYPEGETPDNPFIMEVVRDGKAEFIAEITATNAPASGAEDEAQPVEDQGGTVDSSSKGSSVLPLVIGGVALLAALALIIVFFVRRSRARG
ncbi:MULTISPECIES: hypothetical protein [Corynebacterium]|uniref:hypothetical protein n=1 Tax=Corynebacterium TaxID=1716 RepID=UPI0008B7A281|nr:hypothetical protein [Corynebacterium sp. HMSC071B10]MCG7279588.1 hypothetical protein [Corynebacterium imitans]OFP37402.1 hypothetical protein HMPREF2990_03075 [Corynebacterium sp. HMSC071B10]